MRSAHHRRARVGNRRHAGFTHQTHVLALQGGLQERAGVELAAVIAFFMHLARQFLNFQGLNGLGQRV